MQIQPAENHTQTEQVNGETPSPFEPGEPRRFTKQRRFQQWFQTPSRIAEMRRAWGLFFVMSNSEYSFISQNKNCFQSQSEGVTNTKGKGVFAQGNHLSQVIQSVTFSSLGWRSPDTTFDSVTKPSQKRGTSIARSISFHSIALRSRWSIHPLQPWISASSKHNRLSLEAASLMGHG